MHPAKIAALVALATLLSACGTPYGPVSAFGGTGGYTDKKIAEGKYYIESLTNVPTGPAKALEYWHRRASELCGGKPYTHDAILKVDRKSNYMAPGVTSYHDWPLVTGTATCRPNDA